MFWFNVILLTVIYLLIAGGHLLDVLLSYEERSVANAVLHGIFWPIFFLIYLGKRVYFLSKRW